MKAIIRTGVMTVCISAFLSLFGCKPHILDGPGMVNKAQWTEFSLSTSHSNAQYIYYFTVTDSDEGAFVTGCCRDGEGNLYENDSGIPVPPKTLTALRELGIDELEDVPEPSEEPSSETDEFSDTEEIMILDDSSVELSVVYYTDLKIDKVVTWELSMKIYEILLPVFAANAT